MTNANHKTPSATAPATEEFCRTTLNRRFERFTLVCSWILFTAVLLFLAHRHAAWFDEAQAWLIARDSSFFDILFRRMHYEGTPALWHILLWVLVKLGFPFVATSYLSVALASIGAAIFLRCAPFPLGLRVLFIFGYFPAFQYSVIARSYSLSFPLIMLAAALFPSRTIKSQWYCVTLAALANTNALSFLIAGAVFCEFLWAIWRLHAWSRKHYWPIAIFLAAVGLAVVQAIPAKDVRLSEPWFSLTIVKRLAIEILVSFAQFHTPHNLAGGILVLSQLLLSIGVLTLTLYLARRAGHEKLMLAIFGALMAFATFKYFSLWNAGLIYLAWVFLVWISWPIMPKIEYEKRVVIFVMVAFIFSIQLYSTVAAWCLSLTTPYSAAPLAAARLHDLLSDNPESTLACFGLKALAVEPYFGHNVCGNYYHGSAKPSYYDWKQDQTYFPRPGVQILDKLMRSRRFDLFLVSDLSVSRADAEAVARAQHYCPSDWLQGQMIWKDGFYENDDLSVFQKCAQP